MLRKRDQCNRVPADEVIAKYEQIKEKANAVDNMEERLIFLRDSLDKFDKRELEIIAIYVHESKFI